MSPVPTVLGFLPWIVFGVVADRVDPGAAGIAAMLACVMATALVVSAIVRGAPAKLLEVAGAAAFGLLAVWALVSPASGAFLIEYGPGAVTLGLAALILLTLPLRPFTEQYARESVPREYWDTPRFHAVNRRISAVWGLAVAGMGAAGLLRAGLAANGVAGAFLGWVVPVVLVVAAVQYTRRAAAAPTAVATR